jgi:site-specific recombinase XerD
MEHIQQRGKAMNDMNEYLSPSELLAVLAEAKKHGPREHCIILMAYVHAMRVSELAALTLTDVRNGLVDIRRVKGSLHTIQPLQSSPNALLDEPSVLAAYLKSRGNADGSQFLFISRQGSGLSTRQIENIFEGIAIRSGIEAGRRNIHILKHSLCSHLIRAGQSIAFVQIQAGHADIKNTAYYMHVTSKEAAVETGKTFASIFA